MGGVYYNELDPFAAAWLRELIKAGHIAPGEVDERSITEVQPDDLRRFIQCHFFAGIGVWSYALRAAGWPDDLAVWTGSCPCQSFSASGKRGGFSDQRHLWPAWFRLIRECRPDTIFGEQVASQDGLAWLDVVSSDLEGAGYAIGTADLCAAGFGAPHIRQRLYFVAESASRHAIDGAIQRSGLDGLRAQDRCDFGDTRDSEREEIGIMADASGRRCQQRDTGKRPIQEPDSGCSAGELGQPDGGRFAMHGSASGQPGHGECAGETCELGNSEQPQLEGHAGDERDGNQPRRERADKARPVAEAGFTNGFWADAEWLWCRDEKYRPVEPGTFPLVAGAANRVGRLRGYGNALCAPVAQGFIEAYLDLA